MAVKGGMKDRGYNKYTVGGGHAPVNNQAQLDGTSVAPLSSAGRTSRPSGKPDGAPASRKGGGKPGVPSSKGARQATAKSAPYAKPRAGV